jgi:NADPH-dependent glutamate synthase beta subunit-like oxidoreductase
MAPYFFSAITNIIKSLNNTKKIHGKFGSIYSFFALFLGEGKVCFAPNVIRYPLALSY